MTDMTTAPTAPAVRDTALALSRRWDAQQTGYIRHRAERFATIARVVAGITAGTDAPRVLDLAGGTGSLGRAVLEAVPGARVVIADKDPVLLGIARDAASGDDRTTVAEVDLGRPDWTQHPQIAGSPFDAVVSSTALHWLRPAVLVDVYWAASTLLRPGGVLLNGDHLLYDARHESTLAAVAAADDRLVQTSTFGGDVDTWDQWWEAVADEQRYADALERRAAVWGDDLRDAPPKVTLAFHLETLRSAGFSEAGTVWQYLDDHVVYGVR